MLDRSNDVTENIPDSDNSDDGQSVQRDKVKNQVQAQKLVTKHYSKPYTSSEITQLARRLGTNRQTFGQKQHAEIRELI